MGQICFVNKVSLAQQRVHGLQLLLHYKGRDEEPRCRPDGPRSLKCLRSGSFLKSLPILDLTILGYGLALNSSKGFQVILTRRQV